ncbi:MAG: nuclear transport factor 2 family protein, partial [Reyranella sp.]
MDDLARLMIERECGRLPLLFAKYADNGDHAALAALFTEDCEFARPFQPDHPFYGRDRVQAIFRDRPPILVRHIVTNVLVDVVSETEARGTNYLAMLSCHSAIEPPQPAGGLYVGGFEDHYV